MSEIRAVEFMQYLLLFGVGYACGMGDLLVAVVLFVIMTLIAIYVHWDEEEK